MRIALCDDEQIYREQSLAVVEAYRAPDGGRVFADVYENALDLISNMKHTQYDALLLDIVMPGFSGMEAAKDIRMDNMSIPIVFLTSSPEYAVESYRVHAFDYIMKPIQEEDLCRTLDHIYALYEGRKKDALTINTTKEVYVVPYDQLVYMEISNRILFFHMLDGSVKEVRGKLTDYEELLLKRESFLKIHRSYIINMDHMKSYDRKNFTAMTGEQIPVSRNIAREVQDAYMKYLYSAIRSAK